LSTADALRADKDAIRKDADRAINRLKSGRP
jgi:hypothetical protein